MVDSCTDCPKGTVGCLLSEYVLLSSSWFKTDLDDTLEQIKIHWNQFVATPLWATILAFPENGSVGLRELGDPC